MNIFNSNKKYSLLTILCIILSDLCCVTPKIYIIPPLNDTIMRQEMAFITVFDTLSNTIDVKLNKMTLSYSDEFSTGLTSSNFKVIDCDLHFDFANFDKSEHQITYNKEDSTIIAIDDKLCWGVDKNAPTRVLKEMDLVIHSHLRISIPDNAIEGIYEPPIYYCKNKQDRKKEQHFFKFYVSEDKCRMYIYMLCGEGQNQYEVTWVFYANKYLGRFINKK
jgi:hypothetical protein